MKLNQSSCNNNEAHKILTNKNWNHNLRVRKENDESNAELEMIEHLRAIVGHVEETRADQQATHQVVDELDAETWTKRMEIISIETITSTLTLS